MVRIPVDEVIAHLHGVGTEYTGIKTAKHVTGGGAATLDIMRRADGQVSVAFTFMFRVCEFRVPQQDWDRVMAIGLTADDLRATVREIVIDIWPKEWPTNKHTLLLRTRTIDAIVDRVADRLTTRTMPSADVQALAERPHLDDLPDEDVELFASLDINTFDAASMSTVVKLAREVRRRRTERDGKP
jgi:hypothetical protein